MDLVVLMMPCNEFACAETIVVDNCAFAMDTVGRNLPPSARRLDFGSGFASNLDLDCSRALALCLACIALPGSS